MTQVEKQERCSEMFYPDDDHSWQCERSLNHLGKHFVEHPSSGDIIWGNSDSVYTLLEIADLMEKIKQMTYKKYAPLTYDELELLMGYEDNASWQWPQLFREYPDLVEKIRSEARKND